jgi:hypothetical protein
MDYNTLEIGYKTKEKEKVDKNILMETYMKECGITI